MDGRVHTRHRSEKWINKRQRINDLRGKFHPMKATDEVRR